MATARKNKRIQPEKEPTSYGKRRGGPTRPKLADPFSEPPSYGKRRGGITRPKTPDAPAEDDSPFEDDMDLAAAVTQMVEAGSREPYDRSGSGSRINRRPYDRSGSGARIANARMAPSGEDDSDEMQATMGSLRESRMAPSGRDDSDEMQATMKSLKKSRMAPSGRDDSDEMRATMDSLREPEDMGPEGDSDDMEFSEAINQMLAEMRTPSEFAGGPNKKVDPEQDFKNESMRQKGAGVTNLPPDPFEDGSLDNVASDSLMADFRVAHGGPYNPKSSKDQGKMAILQELRQQYPDDTPNQLALRLYRMKK